MPVGTTTAYKRALLRRLNKQAEMDGITLRAALETLLEAQVDSTSSGNRIISISTNGHSTTFAAPGGDFDEVKLAETVEELLTKLETIETSESLDGDDIGDNDAILTALLKRYPVEGRNVVQSHFGGYCP